MKRGQTRSIFGLSHRLGAPSICACSPCGGTRTISLGPSKHTRPYTGRDKKHPPTHCARLLVLRPHAHELCDQRVGEFRLEVEPYQLRLVQSGAREVSKDGLGSPYNRAG